MLSKILNTPIDDLVTIIKDNPNCTVSFIKQKFNLPFELIERWVLILEEYKVIKVKYKGFEGYIQLIEKNDSKEKDEEINVENLKEIFINKCKSRNLSYEQMRVIWPKFLESYKSDIEQLFVKSAKKKGFENEKIQIAYKKYLEELNNF